MNQQVATIAEREVTRKEFLTIAGMGLLSVMGFGSIIRLLTGKQALAGHSSSSSRSYGYGASAYGR